MNTAVVHVEYYTTAIVPENTRKWVFWGYFCGFHVVFTSIGVVLFFLGHQKGVQK